MRREWLFMLGIPGLLIVLLAIVALIFPEWLSSPRHASGPVAVFSPGGPTSVPKHGFLGVTFDSQSAPLVIHSVLKGSGADLAGLQAGDVILSAADVEKPDRAALNKIIEATVPNTELLLRIGRGENVLEVRVMLISFLDRAILQGREGNEKKAKEE